MAAPTTYHDLTDDLDTGGRLFAGKKFFVVQRVPARPRLLEDIRANGGTVVVLEKLADYVIADQLRPKHCPPGSLSFEFVEQSIKKGALCSPEDHAAGPPLGESREVGALHRPPKMGRSAYTAEDDRLLFEWVRKAEEAGGLSGGNEIYKRLEAKHPNHTWQSWRDRYLKKLRSRPPSAEKPPDAPEAAAEKPAHVTDDTAAATVKYPHSLDELTAMFSAEDWEKLYALVDVIDSHTGPDRLNAWTGWAELKGKQSILQWQQYYEQVIRPQWLSDPESKRQLIKEKIKKKNQEQDSQSQSQSPRPSQHQPIHEPPKEPHKATPGAPTALQNQTPAPSASSVAQKPTETEVAKFKQLLATKQNYSISAAYVRFARDKQSATWAAHPTLDHTALHHILMGQWHSLPEKDQAPYIAMEDAAKSRRVREVARPTKPSSDQKVMSSSTARHESPTVVKEMYDTALKRARSHGLTGGRDDDLADTIRPSKRRKSAGAAPTEAASVGTQVRPPITSSQTSEIPESASTEQRLEDQIISDMAQIERTTESASDDDTIDDPDIATESIEPDEHTYVDNHPPLPEDTDEASSEESHLQSLTPRAPQQKNNFDTQAILASPSQNVFTRAQPKDRILEFQAETDTQRSSPPIPHPESDASTTQSLQEFRRSVNEVDRTHILHPNQHPHLSSLSPAPSSASSASTTSTTSGDPDPPLTAAELDPFFQEQYDDGFGDDFIVAALKRTRMRPGLAIQVLEAWITGQPLPVARGIWAVRDDEDVESGDGAALARLGSLHSVDGWGGVTERLVFLEGLRSR